MFENIHHNMNDKSHGGGLAGRILRVVVVEVRIIYCMNSMTVLTFPPFKKRFLSDPWPENAINSLNQKYNVLNQEVRYRPLIITQYNPK